MSAARRADTAAPRFTAKRPDSHGRLATTDALLAFGLVCLGSAALGSLDAPTDAGVLTTVGGVGVGVGVIGRRTFVPRRNPAAARVLAGLATTWITLVLAGTVVYLLTGEIDTVDGALFESAAGFSTVAATTVNPTELSAPVAIFRGGTQWIGGLVGLFAAVVAIPGTMKGRVQIPEGRGGRARRLAPTPGLGRRRVFGMYVGLTGLCGLGYLLAGMPFRSAVIHAGTTVSTGGMSANLDSFMGESGGARLVATVFMLIAGMSYFVLFWLLRGDHRRFSRSPELRVYLAIVTAVTLLLVIDVDGLSIGDALFTAASASSTTGLAVVDWTIFPDAALSLLLVAVATGAMSASAGSGLRVIRAWLLVAFASRELRGQLDPSAVIVVRHAGRTVGDDELDSLAGYQIAHFGLCAIGAFLLATTGDDLVDALWTAISVVSTSGPSPTMGPFGDADELGRVGQLVIIPGMFAGRLSILPLLLAISSVLRSREWLVMQLRRERSAHR